MSAELRLPPLIDSEEQSRQWAERLMDALAGALLMWVYTEAAFVAAGIFWKEFLGGFGSYLFLSLALTAASPLAAWMTARMLGASRPWDCARWASGPALLFLLSQGALAWLGREQITAYRGYGFSQLCSNGAWVGIFAGFFAGLAFEAPEESAGTAPIAPALRFRHAALGALAGALAWGLLGSFLYFAWQKSSGDPDVHLYFILFLLLGAPFFGAGACQALGAAHPERAAVLSVLPTFALLFWVLRGSTALLAPAGADALIGSLPWLGLAQGAACGLLSGLSWRAKGDA